MIRLVKRRAEHRHDGVSHIFVQQTVVLEHLAGHGGEIFVQQRHQPLRRQLLGNGGKVPDI
ncbi:MAG: hypothetical protein MZV70_60020 [Desulfobacterales bacterium]|nr:hypothetical protein [Desulfobacterales bacterium]